MKKTPLNQQKKPAVSAKKTKTTNKPAVKKYKPTALEKKNLKDATENKNMRPPFNQKKKNNK
jgi:hypothetical protein